MPLFRSFCLLAMATISLAAAEGYRVLGTIGMVSDVVTHVAGDRATVTSMLGPGIDPHLYKPTRSDVAMMMQSDVIFYSGLMLEGKMSDVLVRLAVSGKKVYPVTELLDDTVLLQPEEFEGHYDPHVWNDPQAWMKTVDVIQAKLTEYDPDGAATYQANAAATKAKIAEVDAYAEKVLNSVPESQRVLVTAHDAFNYFARRFGYEVMGVQGLSTESEAGVKDIEALVQILVDRKITAIFVETSVSDRNIKALIEGAAAKGHKVVIGGELFSDAMGKDGTYESSFVGMVDHNVTTIARALGGDAPEKGLHGKLGAGH